MHLIIYYKSENIYQGVHQFSFNHDTLLHSNHVTTRKLQFAEEGPTLHVESYELSKTLRWYERLINSIILYYNSVTSQINLYTQIIYTK